MKDVRQPIVIQVAKLGAHSSDHASVRGVCHALLKRHILECSIAVVAQKEIWRRVVRNKNIRVAIAIKIPKGQAHSLAYVLTDVRSRGDIGKGPVAVVLVQNIWRALEVTRRAIGSRLADRAQLRGRNVVIKVVDDHQIEPSGVVCVEPSSRHCPGLSIAWDPSAHARLLRYVSKCAVAVVVQQLVAIDACHV